MGCCFPTSSASKEKSENDPITFHDKTYSHEWKERRAPLRHLRAESSFVLDRSVELQRPCPRVEGLHEVQTVEEVSKRLRENGDLHTLDERGNTWLTAAMRNTYGLSVVVYLLQNGANPHTRPLDYERFASGLNSEIASILQFAQRTPRLCLQSVHTEGKVDGKDRYPLAVFHCSDCVQDICNGCELLLHVNTKSATHRRHSIVHAGQSCGVQSCKRPAHAYCIPCGLYLCLSCMAARRKTACELHSPIPLDRLTTPHSVLLTHQRVHSV